MLCQQTICAKLSTQEQNMLQKFDLKDKTSKKHKHNI